uniref:YCF48-related protein n=1 Tax=Roseihalotalea indica TaxID=2867963 RepID=A0AA49JGL3_9BACT|nr:YCF48-related protein [Tunicatimonas sp. TK19036]
MKRFLLPFFLLTATLLCFSCQDNTPSVPLPPTLPPGASVFDWVVQDNAYFITLHDVSFANNSEGWAVGKEGALLSTTSGGVSWLLPPSALTNETLYSVSLVDQQNGWVAGQRAEEEEGGQVFRSQQGGAYPEEQTQTAQPLYTIQMLTNQEGWAAGGQGLLLRTTDGGSTWTSATVANEETILDVHFLDTGQGWLTTARGSIYRTDDGNRWQPEATADTLSIRAIQAISDTVVWACGDRNRILHRIMTEDGTPAWELFRIDSEANSMIWHDIFFVDALQGWVVGEEGSIYHTTDGGTTWARQLTNASSRPDLYGIHMVSAQLGWVVGEEGTIMVYTP